MIKIEKGSKIGLFGGTFDPVHIAHLIIADRVLEQAGLDFILFVPGAIPPHKQNRKISPGEIRYQMLQLALQDNPCFLADDLELQRGRISYTIDTINQLYKNYPLDARSVYLIIGADNLLDFHNWKKPHEIVEKCHIIAVRRPYSQFDRHKMKIDIPYMQIEAPLLEVSSSDIRQRVRQGKSIRYLVPSRVERFIYENNIYKD